MFAKIFTINIITIIIGLILSALLQYVFIIRLIDEELKTNLRSDAYDIQRIITAITYMEEGIEPNASEPVVRFRMVRGGMEPFAHIAFPELGLIHGVEVNAAENFVFINAQLDREVLLQTYLDAYTLITGNYVIFIDTFGEIVLSSYQLPNDERLHKISDTYYLGGSSEERGIIISDLGILNSRKLTYHLPIIVQGETVGSIFVCSPILPGMGRRQILFSVFLLPMLLVTVISLIFSYILSRKITKPIKEIGYAAKAFSKGEFKERVNVRGRDEISQLSETFNQMADDLEKIEQLRRSFVANVSHELRTPMTTIIGFIDGILDGTIPESSHTDYLAIVLSESKRLSRLISDLLDITRMEEDEFCLDIIDFDINELVRRSIIAFERLIEEKNIEVKVNFGSDVCFVSADSDGISRVLMNLIDNAIKFTNQNGIIDINITLSKSTVVISIRNTGIGISEVDRKNIFDRFYKADQSRGINREGTGLGLFIVKNILNLHGRGIVVNSVLGEYAEFTFTLPTA